MKLVSIVGVIALLTFLTYATFNGITNKDILIDASDAPVFFAIMGKKILSEGHFSCANPAMGMGASGPIVLGDFSPLFTWLLPVYKVDEGIMAFSVFMSALFMYLFLRDRRYGVFASLVGAVAFGFSTTIISIVKAGHVGKFCGLAYLAASLWMMGRAFKTGGWIWTAFGGIMLGYAFATARDTVLVVALGIGAFWIREIISTSQPAVNGSRNKMMIQLVLAGVMAFLIMWPILNLLAPVIESGVGAVKETPEERYEWATQWSLPPDEIPKLIAPTYCGLDSWNPIAPYWGRMGQTAGWEMHKQGFMNFTQTNEYIGVTIFILMLGAVIAFVPRFKQKTLELEDEETPPNDTIFWLATGIIALFLAFGKYTPLYKVFYSLPMMSSMRNPVKFMHLVALAASILSAQGVFLMCKAVYAETNAGKYIKPLLISASVVAVLFMMMYLAAPWSKTSLNTIWLRYGFNAQQIDGIKGEMIKSIGRSFLFSLGFLAVFAAVLSSAIRKNNVPRFAIQAVLFVLLCADIMMASKFYISYSDPSMILHSNSVIDYIKQYPAYRTKFLPHNQGIFNQWNSLLTSVYLFKSPDMPAESRVPPDRQAFNIAVGNKPLVMWKLLGVKHLIYPAQFEDQIRKLSATSIIPVKGFDLVQDQIYGIMTEFRQSPTQGMFRISEYTGGMPCGVWYGNVKSVPFTQMCAAIADPSNDLDKTLYLDAQTVKAAGIQFKEIQTISTGVCELVEYSENYMKLKSKADVDGWIFVNDYYDGKWKAFVGGKEVPVVRADGIFRALPVPAGNNEVEMRFAGSEATFWMPLIVVSITIGAAILYKLISMIILRKKV